ncbi:MAG: prolipoprotein diacylglyceryl transferase [Syntrophomonas sp.]
MHPVLFEWGPITVYSWGFMLAVAVITGMLGAGKILSRQGMDKEIVFDLVIIMVVCGLLGGRFLYISIYEWEPFLADPLMVLNPGVAGISGMVWYGSMLGGFLGFVAYIWKKRLPFWTLADIFAPFVALGYAIVRIGCFLAGCCYGKVCTLPFAVVFPNVDAIPRHPTQLYSSGINLLLFLFLIWFLPRKKFPGQVFLIYMMAYSIYRFFMEFLRANLVMYGPFSNSQTYSLVIFLAAIVLYVWQASRYKSKA